MANRPQPLDSKVLTISDLKAEADKKLPRTISEYFNHGADDMTTLHDNEAAYARYKLRPRILRNVGAIDTSTTIFGVKASIASVVFCHTPIPLGFAPCAAQKLAHADGENGVSRAAARHGLAMCLSSWANTELGEVAAQSVHHDSSNPYVMQVSLLNDKAAARRILRRAEDQTIEWEMVVPWLREHTSMEIWLKGVYTPEDVLLAIRHKLDGVVISNHGGRQLDGVPATLDALRECAPVAKGKIGIAVDGGIRRGSDIFRALALGADYCFYNGEAGVDLAIKILMREFKATMALTGFPNIVK
ncbi:putative fmn-dependent dehydrogenase family protein [Diplodia seriata]|uniref:Putative fmn-dependent dehydrogenase family protein n=1 Tax=Diplodia seriata TaxID=420778 RepID=A0A0G2FNK1_9PEZI|nr:putative fmn-dependent dehydrogenase family protein [Diplodia seriata]